MEPIRRALWHIESHLMGAELSMDDVARAAGVSRFHLSRMFANAIGQSAMSYSRGRRLSEAAKLLAGGAPDILAVALEYGYASHEGFTRAFRDQFGATPESVRAASSTDAITLVEPMHMTGHVLPDLDPPRFDTAPTLLIAGIGRRYKPSKDVVAIPLQWQRLSPYFGAIPHAVGDIAYGVIHDYDNDGAFSYLAGVEVSRFDDLPKEFSTVRIPERRYAIFTHRGHISSIPGTMTAIWQKWAPEHGHSPVDAPGFERYDERFNPETGEGEVEVWVPVEDR